MCANHFFNLKITDPTVQIKQNAIKGLKNTNPPVRNLVLDFLLQGFVCLFSSILQQVQACNTL